MSLRSPFYAPKQFIITQEQTALPEGWQLFRFSDLHILHSPELPVTTVQIGQVPKAAIIGWFGSAETGFLPSKVVSFTSDSEFTRWKLSVTGRFLILEKTINDICITTDAGGLFPVLIDLRNGLVASSSYAIDFLEPTAIDHSVRDNIVRVDGKKWFPFGLTLKRSVRRLLPREAFYVQSKKIDHYDKFPIEISHDADATTTEIFNDVSNFFRSASDGHEIEAHLTAGYDSRMILAAILGAGVKANFSTIRTKDGGSLLDCLIAKRLAERVKMKHSEIAIIEPSETDILRWRERTGFAIEDAVERLCRTAAVNDFSGLSITGTAGEVGRSFYWEKSDLEKRGLSEETLLARMGFQANTYSIKAAANWLDKYDSDLPRTELLDWAYIDNRLCCWAGPSAVGHNTKRPTFSPFNSRAIFRKMLSLPPHYRFSGTFSLAFISRGDSRLLDLPFNQAIGIYRLFFLRQEIKKIAPPSLIRAAKKLKTYF